MTIIPTILEKSKPEFTKRFQTLSKFSKKLHIDFMDGRFVKSKSIQLSQIPNLKRFKKNMEAHLMVSNPRIYIQKLKQKNFQKVIFHFSALKTTNEINSLITLIKSKSLEPWIAINPEIRVEKIVPFLFEVRGVLLMAVHPGKENQKFIRSTYKKIKLLRKINSKIKIQVDGGVNEKTTKKLAKLRVNEINSGSFISDAENPRAQFQKLNALFRKNSK